MIYFKPKHFNRYSIWEINEFFLSYFESIVLLLFLIFSFIYNISNLCSKIAIFILFTSLILVIIKTKYDLYLKGASKWTFNMKNWTPYQVGDMILSDFMKLEINGVEKNLDNNLILLGCGDGSKGDHSNWVNLNHLLTRCQLWFIFYLDRLVLLGGKHV